MSQGGMRLSPVDDPPGDEDYEFDESATSKAGLVHVTTTEIEPMSNVKESLKMA